MTRKMEDAIGALEADGSTPAPFSELGSRNAVLNRVRIAERALRLIAGEDPGLLMKEVPTFANSAKNKPLLRQKANVLDMLVFALSV